MPKQGRLPAAYAGPLYGYRDRIKTTGPAWTDRLHDLFRNRRGKPSSRRPELAGFVLALALLCDSDQMAFPSLDEVALFLGITASMVSRTLKQCEVWGLLRHHRGSAGVPPRGWGEVFLRFYTPTELVWEMAETDPLVPKRST